MTVTTQDCDGTYARAHAGRGRQGTLAERIREDPPRGRLPGPSEEGGSDGVEESLPERRTRACTCVVSSAI
ncbi:hypothetical protein [Streptomyces sp. SYSU K217416]